MIPAGKCSARAAAKFRTCSATLPLFEFLAPSFAPQIRTGKSRRSISTTKDAQHSGDNASQITNTTSKKLPPTPLSPAQREFLTKALRVNQAGELAATLIYTAQTPPIVNKHPHLRPLMKHMYDQEAGHFETFNHLLAKHRIRPTAMYPLWSIAATTLGWTTAVMGREAAMACTEAVETEIGTHYNDQVRELLYMIEGMEKNGEEVGDELRELVTDIRRIRDEELEHLDHAVDNDAKEANPYELLTGVIRAGCKGAIWITERS